MKFFTKLLIFSIIPAILTAIVTVRMGMPWWVVILATLGADLVADILIIASLARRAQIRFGTYRADGQDEDNEDSEDTEDTNQKPDIMIEALLDSYPLGELKKGEFLVSVEDLSDNTFSILICGADDLRHLGMPVSLSVCPDSVDSITAVDDEGAEHRIKIIKRG